MASILRYRPRRSRADSTAWLGMIVFLASWTMLFAALFAVYGVLRMRSPAWPPPDVPSLPLLLPAANTLAILASSVALQSALRSARSGRIGGVLPAALAALGLGAIFLAGQVALWTGLWRAGLRPEGGPFPSVFYGLTAFHALHVLVGLFGLGFVAIRASRTAYGPTRHLGLRLWCGYWHFVGAIWVLLFLSIFVL
ncbi:MAG: cytochrome c oxidase subunit 3 [Myxococcales bacterium]